MMRSYLEAREDAGAVLGKPCQKPHSSATRPTSGTALGLPACCPEKPAGKDMAAKMSLATSFSVASEGMEGNVDP